MEGRRPASDLGSCWTAVKPKGWNLDQTKVHRDFAISFHGARFQLCDHFKRSPAERNTFLSVKQASVAGFKFSQGQPLFSSLHPPQVMESSHTPGAGQNPCPTSLRVDGGVPLFSNHPRRVHDIFPGCPKGLCCTCVTFASWYLCSNGSF